MELMRTGVQRNIIPPSFLVSSQSLNFEISFCKRNEKLYYLYLFDFNFKLLFQYIKRQRFYSVLYTTKVVKSSKVI